MSRAVTIIIDERAWAALYAEARVEGVDFATYLGRILNARVADQDTRDALLRMARRRNADPPSSAHVGLPPRLAPTQWNAIDAALDRAGLVPDRSGR